MKVGWCTVIGYNYVTKRDRMRVLGVQTGPCCNWPIKKSSSVNNDRPYLHCIY